MLLLLLLLLLGYQLKGYDIANTIANFRMNISKKLKKTPPQWTQMKLGMVPA